MEQHKKKQNVFMSPFTPRAVVMIAMLSAVAFVLQLLDFALPMIIPSFVKMDLSDLPALIGSFSLGPVAGALICIIKNLLHALFMGQTGGIGELCNALIGIALVMPAGIIYRALNAHNTDVSQSKKKGRIAALIGCLVGSVISGAASVPINYFISYPMYAKFMPIDTIIEMYQKILPSAGGLLSCLVIFNMPFTILKGVLCSIITFIIYKPLSRFIKGNKSN